MGAERWGCCWGTLFACVLFAVLMMLLYIDVENYSNCRNVLASVLCMVNVYAMYILLIFFLNNDIFLFG